MLRQHGFSLGVLKMAAPRASLQSCIAILSCLTLAWRSTSSQDHIARLQQARGGATTDQGRNGSRSWLISFQREAANANGIEMLDTELQKQFTETLAAIQATIDEQKRNDSLATRRAVQRSIV